MNFGKEINPELNDNWNNCMVCQRFYKSCVIPTAKLTWISCDTITSFLYWLSSAPVYSTQHCWPAWYHKQLIPQNFQPYDWQNICLSIVSDQEDFYLGLCRVNAEVIKLVWHRIIFADSSETIYWTMYKPQKHDSKAGTYVFCHCDIWNSAFSRAHSNIALQCRNDIVKQLSIITRKQSITEL